MRGVLRWLTIPAEFAQRVEQKSGFMVYRAAGNRPDQMTNSPVATSLGEK